MSEFFKIDSRLLELAEKAEADCREAFARISEIETFNNEKVLRAFIDNHDSSNSVSK